MIPGSRSKTVSYVGRETDGEIYCFTLKAKMQRLW